MKCVWCRCVPHARAKRLVSPLRAFVRPSCLRVAPQAPGPARLGAHRSPSARSVNRSATQFRWYAIGGPVGDPTLPTCGRPRPAGPDGTEGLSRHRTPARRPESTGYSTGVVENRSPRHASRSRGPSDAARPLSPSDSPGFDSSRFSSSSPFDSRRPVQVCAWKVLRLHQAPPAAGAWAAAARRGLRALPGVRRSHARVRLWRHFAVRLRHSEVPRTHRCPDPGRLGQTPCKNACSSVPTAESTQGQAPPDDHQAPVAPMPCRIPAMPTAATSSTIFPSASKE